MAVSSNIIDHPKLPGLLDYLRAGARCVIYLAGGGWRRRAHDRPPAAPVRVPDGFIGICVAAPDQPEGDAYVLDRLRLLGLRHVRLDLTQRSEAGPQARLLQKLLDADYRVCLHLVQPRSAARRMTGRNAAGAQARRDWHDFVTFALDRWGAHLECVEIGATCNRRKWAGYSSPAGLLAAWRIAWTAVRARGIKIIGPNVTDFEPPYNCFLLDLMQGMGCPPDAHTNNIFVERVTQPEVYDHRVLGRAAAGWLRFNLLRKIGLLHDIGRRHGVPDLICAHVAWSLRRIARLLEHTEEKQADYLARYMLLAAAGGGLRRVYWGPLISQREGLIDDGTLEYPDPPHVACYGRAPGTVAQFRERPARHTLAQAQKSLAGSTFLHAHAIGSEMEILAFQNAGGGLWHAVWTRNGRLAAADDCYHAAALASAEWHDRDGRRLERPPAFFGESPVYLTWPQSPPATVKAHPAPLAGWRFHYHGGQQFKTIDFNGWTGMQAACDPDGFLTDRSLADAVEPPAQAVVLRDGRNRVWRRPHPAGPDRPAMIIKQFQLPKRWRRLLDYGKPSKAVRSWNNAQELMRRGLPTPRPLAALLPADAARQAVYICEDFEPDCSVRDVFNALNQGHTCLQLEAGAWYAAIAAALIKMHARGVFFRDLSAGNLLVKCRAAATPDFSLIDTARARFYPRSLSLGRRLDDLRRICHPLCRGGRLAFLDCYMRAAGRRWHIWMYLPFMCYDLKHMLKNRIKPLRRRWSAWLGRGHAR